MAECGNIIICYAILFSCIVRNSFQYVTPEITEATETDTVANIPNSTAWNSSWLGFEFSCI
jgi:hypothetical protein